MNIFVLEDDFAQQTRMETIIREVTRKHKIPLKKFEVYGKPHQLLAVTENKGIHQLFFWILKLKMKK